MGDLGARVEAVEPPLADLEESAAERLPERSDLEPDEDDWTLDELAQLADWRRVLERELAALDAAYADE